MGSVSDSYDNALMENFFSTLKTELVYRNSWRAKEEAENTQFAYIDGWYNRERIQARLGWRSPDEYEAAWHAQQAVLDDQPATTTGGVDPEALRLTSGHHAGPLIAAVSLPSRCGRCT
jgi:putative transposase